MEEITQDQLEKELTGIRESMRKNEEELTLKRNEFASKLVNTISIEELSNEYYYRPLVYKKPFFERVKLFFERLKRVFFSQS